MDLHDRYDIDIEHAIRVLPYDGRDNDEAGKELFWDLAVRVVNEFNTFSHDEKIELLYNAFHKIREATLEEQENQQAREDRRQGRTDI